MPGFPATAGCPNIPQIGGLNSALNIFRCPVGILVLIVGWATVVEDRMTRIKSRSQHEAIVDPDLHARRKRAQQNVVIGTGERERVTFQPTVQSTSFTVGDAGSSVGRIDVEL